MLFTLCHHALHDLILQTFVLFTKYDSFMTYFIKSWEVPLFVIRFGTRLTKLAIFGFGTIMA